MKNVTKNEIQKKEIDFMVYFEKVMLPRRRNITRDLLVTCSQILGKNIVIGTCSSCLHGVAIEFMNEYNRLKPFYEEYLKKIQLENEQEIIKEIQKLEKEKLENEKIEYKKLEEPPRIKKVFKKK